MKETFLTMFSEFAALPSLSGSEEHVRSLILSKLEEIGIRGEVDQYGNVIAILSGRGEPLMLNAHMDRVKPGLGYIPRIEGDLVYSDGTTNSGADDILGIVSILLILKEMKTNATHRPLVAVFTIEEEIGAVHGAKLVDVEAYHINEGIVIDNAFPDAGVLVERGSNLLWVTTTISGTSGHSGKDLSQTVNAVAPLLQSEIRVGSYNNDETRVNMGSITVLPGVGNAIPEKVVILTEIRSFLMEEEILTFINTLFKKLYTAADAIGAHVDTHIDIHCKSYVVDRNEPLVRSYEAVLTKRGASLSTQSTFVGSDANSFRARGYKTIVLSTGARNEHTTAEYFDVNGIIQLTQDIIELIENDHK